MYCCSWPRARTGGSRIERWTTALPLLVEGKITEQFVCAASSVWPCRIMSALDTLAWNLFERIKSTTLALRARGAAGRLSIRATPVISAVRPWRGSRTPPQLGFAPLFAGNAVETSVFAQARANWREVAYAVAD